jgi:hypothetical protein
MATCTTSAHPLFLSHHLRKQQTGNDVCVLPAKRYKLSCPVHSTAHPLGYGTVKALNLPNYRLLHTPQCYANITIDENHVFNTKVLVGSSPEWDQCFNV